MTTLELFFVLFFLIYIYLKCRPVHMHSRAVIVAEPFQVLLCVCSQDRALQLSVYCGIAARDTKEKHGYGERTGIILDLRKIQKTNKLISRYSCC